MNSTDVLEAVRSAKTVAPRFWERINCISSKVPENPFARSTSRARWLFQYYLLRIAQVLVRFAEHKDASQSWYQACMTLALVSAHRSGRNESIAVLTNIYNKQVGPDGLLKFKVNQIWQAMGGYALVYLSEHASDGDRYNGALRQLWLSIREARKSDNGSLLYTASHNDILVDVIGMVCPFLAAYARKMQDREVWSLLDTHFRQFFEHCIDPITHLPFHAYHSSARPRLGHHGWGRGTGWYVVGLVDTLAELDGDSTGLRESLQTQISNVMATLASCQRANGNWGTQLLIESTRDDLSATAYIAYAFARALRLGLIDLRYRSVLEKAIVAIAINTNRQGRVRGASAEAFTVGDLGYSFGYYPWCDAFAAAAIFEFEGLTQAGK